MVTPPRSLKPDRKAPQMVGNPLLEPTTNPHHAKNRLFRRSIEFRDQRINWVQGSQILPATVSRIRIPRIDM